MGTTYHLVNITKREIIWFTHIGAFKAHELAGNPVSAAITTWYLLTHLSDQINFVSEDDDIKDIDKFTEVTDRVVDELIKDHILVDEGKEFYFDDEPDVYTRKLRNIYSEYRGPI